MCGVELLACVSTLYSMFWSSCSRFTCLCRLKSLRLLKSTPQNAVDFARIHDTFKKITTRANDGVAYTASAKRISRNFSGSKKNIKFVSPRAVSRRSLALSDINRQRVKCMSLTSFHDFYCSWPLYICRSLFGHSIALNFTLIRQTDKMLTRRWYKLSK